MLINAATNALDAARLTRIHVWLVAIILIRERVCPVAREIRKFLVAI